jgi:orotate phosphoribosyltransferase
MTDARHAFKELMEQHALRTGLDVMLSSGRRSRYYVDCRAVSMTYRGRRLIAELGQEMFYDMMELSFDAIGGVAVGGIPVAMAMADGEDVFIVRAAAKEHGLGKAVEGADHLVGRPVVIVEDAVTTGESLRKALVTAADFGLRPVLALSLVSRSEGGVLESFSIDSEHLGRINIPHRTALVAQEPGILSIM